MANDTDDQPVLASIDDVVRPFVATGGRAAGTVAGLEPGTTVQITWASGGALRFEAATIHQLCRRAMTLSELAAGTGLPIGAVAVLVGDLLDGGKLRIVQPPTGTAAAEPAQLDVLNRFVNGVRRLWH